MSAKPRPPKLVRMRTTMRTAVIVLLSFLMAATLAVLPANAASAQAVTERQAIAKFLSDSGVGTAVDTAGPTTAGAPQSAPTQAGGKTVSAPPTPIVQAPPAGGSSTVQSAPKA